MAIAARRERVAWWSRDFTVPTGTPTISAIVASGRPGVVVQHEDRTVLGSQLGRTRAR